MVRFFTQTYPKMPAVRSSSINKHPGCLTVINGSLVPFSTLVKELQDKKNKAGPTTQASSKNPGSHSGIVNEEVKARAKPLGSIMRKAGSSKS